MKASNISKCLKQGVDPPRGNPNNPEPPPEPESKTNKESAVVPGEGVPPPSSAPEPPAPRFIEPPAPHFIEPPPAGPQPNFYPGPQPGLQPPKSVNIPQPNRLDPSPQSQYMGGGYSASAIIQKRKVDPKNPYNEVGKIVRQHPKYFEVLDKAQKLMESAMSDMGTKSLARAAKNLEEAYKLLDLLEN